MNVGAWNVNVIVGGMPEKVATAIGKLAEQLIGAEYTPIAYLGAQVVNGTNHAVLAEQILTTGKDTKNIVLLIFNEKGMDCDLVNIERVVEGGEELGGTEIAVSTDIPEEAQEVFDKALAGFVGSGVVPFALLAKQVVAGVNFVFAAEITPVIQEPVKKVAIVTVNSLSGKVAFTDILGGGINRSLGCPLGEWP